MKIIWNKDHSTTAFEYGSLDVSSDATKGFRPFQLMVASIAGCSAGIFNNILVKQRITFDSFEIEAEVERNESGAQEIKKITLNFIIKGKDLNEAKLQRNLELTRKNCSMVQSVKDSIEIEEKLTIVE